MNQRQCPICGNPSTAKLRPFCSARCADIDLNRWLTGGYSIPDEAEDQPVDSEDSNVGKEA